MNSSNAKILVTGGAGFIGPPHWLERAATFVQPVLQCLVRFALPSHQDAFVWIRLESRACGFSAPNVN
jgi:hypothetical protein